MWVQIYKTVPVRHSLFMLSFCLIVYNNIVLNQWGVTNTCIITATRLSVGVGYSSHYFHQQNRGMPGLPEWTLPKLWHRQCQELRDEHPDTRRRRLRECQRGFLIFTHVLDHINNNLLDPFTERVPSSRAVQDCLEWIQIGHRTHRDRRLIDTLSPPSSSPLNFTDIKAFFMQELSIGQVIVGVFVPSQDVSPALLKQ